MNANVEPAAPSSPLRRRLLAFALADIGIGVPHAAASTPALEGPPGLNGYTASTFADEDGEARPIYRRGDGPGILLLHELPGLTSETVAFGNWLVSNGFHVVMPLLFGAPEQPESVGLALGGLVCLRKEFHCLRSGQPSPLTRWLRALGRKVYDDQKRKGIGVIGMCLTGGFALAMMADDIVLAPVAAQPSLPFLPADGLDVEEKLLAQAAARADRAPLLALRFADDWRCTEKRFEAIEKALCSGADGSCARRFRPVVVPGNSHSTLTGSYNDALAAGIDTRERVLKHLREQLL